MLLHTTETRVLKIPLRPKDIVWGVQQNRQYASGMSHLERVLANFHTSKKINNTQLISNLAYEY